MRRYLYLLATDQDNKGIAQFVKFILKVCSYVYGIIVQIRNFLYDQGVLKSYSIGVPVISVGNITMGGSGKTPLVIFLARQLQASGFKPVILIRGYGSNSADEGVSDEVILLNAVLKGVPILQGPDRVENAKGFLKKDHCDVFILDDGFQHRKIHRDINIVTVDLCNPFGNGHLIPRGILREPIKALRRGDLIVLTRTDLASDQKEPVKNKIMGIHPKAVLVETMHRPVQFVDLKDLNTYEAVLFKDKTALAFCAIGNPDGFAGTLKEIGIELQDMVVYEDHHVYTETDVDHLIIQGKKEGVDALITTAKDAVKLKPYLHKITNPLKIFYLEISIEVTYGQENLDHRIDSLLRH
ncbi:MAG: tetraacyldisaccharide 4'-kinase [Candidatus Omnitrophica bacterium]|nr:tetraacyldisaccharide 4'-kinase [Candidatus Omnitrophota bacterium]